MDNSYGHTREGLIDSDNGNMEHLLPEKAGKNWRLKAADIKRYVSRLGNLTIVDKTINSIAGNKKMKEKVDILKTSRLPINGKLVEETMARDYQ